MVVQEQVSTWLAVERLWLTSHGNTTKKHMQEVDITSLRNRKQQGLIRLGLLFLQQLRVLQRAHTLSGPMTPHRPHL